MTTNRWLPALVGAGFALVTATLFMAFFYAPVAQCDAGCLTQKIFYFHVPSAYVMYLGVGTCCIGSFGYVMQRTKGWDALAQAGAEIAVLFACVVLTTGPLWGRKAWGTYWVWDPRLTSTLLGVLIFVSYLVLRSSGGESEKRFSAALALMGTAVMPVIHYSVQLWRGQHPTVITRSGGGLNPLMGQTLGMGFLAFTVLAAGIVALRAHMLHTEAELEELRTEAAAAGLLDEEEVAS